MRRFGALLLAALAAWSAWQALRGARADIYMLGLAAFFALAAVGSVLDGFSAEEEE